jgi:hypothetical protein
MNISSEINMSTAAAAQPILTVVKDKFTKVLTKGTLSPSTKPVTTLILNEYRQSSNSSVSSFQVQDSKMTQNAYC